MRYVDLIANEEPRITFMVRAAIIDGIRDFCRLHGLTHSNLFATFNGGQNFHRGYRILARFNDQSKDVHSSEWKWAASRVDGDMVWTA
jgi:hypothetical protein